MRESADFALLGHQESWDQVSRIVHTLRAPDKPPLPAESVREIMPWIPARTIARMVMRSVPDERTVRGVYIESFITPDELGPGTLRQAIGKVRDAIRCAVREGAKVAALGGFTSIVIEGQEELHGGIALTTGNTLTAAFIVKGLERAAFCSGVPLADATLVIAGATGDIGTACARYFSGRTRRLVLSARRADRLARLAAELRVTGAGAEVLVIGEALPMADLVISVASLAGAEWDLADCQPGAIVCDAGYPKNLRPSPPVGNPVQVFHGGMGRIQGGWVSDSAVLDTFYTMPAPFIAHGCMLEGIVLAMEERYEPYSRGRGHITPARIEEVWQMAARHGVGLAPLYNHDGLWVDGDREPVR